MSNTDHHPADEKAVADKRPDRGSVEELLSDYREAGGPAAERLSGGGNHVVIRYGSPPRPPRQRNPVDEMEDDP